MEHTETELSEPLACFLCLGLGLGLLYLGKQVMWALFCSFLVESFLSSKVVFAQLESSWSKPGLTILSYLGTLFYRDVY
jgi:hypothetical protein